MILTKIKHTLIVAIILFLLLIPVSIWFALYPIHSIIPCYHGWSEYIMCTVGNSTTGIVSLPVLLIHTVTPIRFYWSDVPQIGIGWACHRQYHGLKVGKRVVFITIVDCPPI